MKNRKRRLLCGALCAVMLFASTGSVLAVSCTNYSDWFRPSYNEMNELNLIPSEFAGYDLKKNITRGEMSVLAVHAYGLITKNAIELERTDYFSDTTDKTILEAYELGIVSGYPDGTFRPDQYLTRQEFFKIIQNFCNAVAYHPSVDGANLSKFNDSGSLSSWALEAAKICVKCEYVNGTKTASGLSLNPAANTSRQEAMAMFLRCFKGLRQYYYEVVLSATVVIDEEDYDPNVTVTDFSATRYVTASTLNVRDSWSSGSTKVGTLSFGAKVSVTGKCSNGWVRIQYDGHVAYVSGKYLTEQQPASGSTPVTPSTGGNGAAAEIAEFVMSFVGYSYVYGGSKPSTGFDCSGLMYYCLTQYGYSMNRVANDQMSQGTAVSRDQLIVGDLVFFGYSGYANHVGMYIGNGNFVHASSPSTGVRVNSLNETYYNTRYIGARRIITG